MKSQHLLSTLLAAVVASIPTLAVAAAPIDPCALLTRTEAKQVLGAPIQSVIPAKVEFLSIGRECRYVAVLSTQGGSIELYIYDDATVRSDKDSLFKSAADFFRRNMHAMRVSGVKLVAAPDLGNSAYWEPGADTLHVLDRGIYIKIWVDPHLRMTHVPSSKNFNEKIDAVKREAAVRIAHYVLPRLAHPSSPSTIKPLAGSSGGLPS